MRTIPMATLRGWRISDLLPGSTIRLLATVQPCKSTPFTMPTCAQAIRWEERHLYWTLQTMLVRETSARFLVSWVAHHLQICKMCNSPTAVGSCRRDAYFGLRMFPGNIVIEGERLAEAEPNPHSFTGFGPSSPIRQRSSENLNWLLLRLGS